MILLSKNNEHKDTIIKDLEYKAYLKQKLEKEIEENLHKKFSKNFRVTISADADVLTESELNNDEKIEVLKLISTYLLDFDIKSLNYDSRN